MKNLADITAAQLRRAADIREQVDKLAHELHVIFGLSSEPQNPRGWSEARRKKFDRTIASRQPQAPKPRTMSAAARAKISAAAKRRWAKAKAAGRKSL